MDLSNEVDVDTSPGIDLTVAWNYAAELDTLKVRLSKPGSEHERVRHLIATCMMLTENSELESRHLLSNELLVTHETGGSQGNVISNTNPLHIPEMLKEVLSYLPVESLLTCRVVNQTWNDMVLPLLRKKSVWIQIPEKNESVKFFNAFEKAEVLPLIDLTVLLQDLSLDNCSFFTKHGLQIRGLAVIDRPSRSTEPEPVQAEENLKKLQHIFRQVPNLKKLELNLDSVPETFIFDKKEILTLSQVEQLNLSLSPIPQNQSHGFLDGVFTLLPNIKDITVESDDWEVFVGTLRKWKIRKFDWSIQPNDPGLWRALAAAEGTLRLEQLGMTLKLDEDHDTAQSLALVQAQQNYLRCQADNLEVLKLDLQSFPEDAENLPKLQLPVMKCLKNLILFLGGPNDTYPLVPIEPDRVPNLRIVCMMHAPTFTLTGIFANSVFSSVQELEIQTMGSVDYSEVLPQLGACFPNLSKIKGLCILFAEDIETIVSNWPNIEKLELNILFENETSAQFNLILSGVPVGNEWAMSMLTERVGSAALSSWIDPPRPSFRRLKRLKALDLAFYRSDEGSFVINEISVHLAFLRLSSQLRLTLRNSFSIREDLAAKLKAHFRNLYLDPTKPKAVESKSGAS